MAYDVVSIAKQYQSLSEAMKEAALAAHFKPIHF